MHASQPRWLSAWQWFGQKFLQFFTPPMCNIFSTFRPFWKITENILAKVWNSLLCKQTINLKIFFCFCFWFCFCFVFYCLLFCFCFCFCLFVCFFFFFFFWFVLFYFCFDDDNLSTIPSHLLLKCTYLSGFSICHGKQFAFSFTSPCEIYVLRICNKHTPYFWDAG